MKYLVAAVSMLMLVACNSNQSTTAGQTEELSPPAAQVDTTPVATETVEPAQDPMRELWERYCNHEALTVEERQMIAEATMPVDLQATCIQK
ncbi:hypothetical protein [Zooshikella harenae]|uniref:Uncharacterized protein n=1 Tax=Zooshikella harenae TaxID=2827238 RepID=A0ABS5ZCU9_9GAMM|nr:hypothetical protein [Zooshikella harenae]MBU2711830.1 hypothetical protein [Zooshikella harenae]